ncbi:hemolysin family protein [uncultured Desulfuromonas sp.]|uniref:hemolysin family protein n=1 Tax=uncultured Desulfuromonas sp. TaxID=181013 RepID=UPI002610AD43|nr:hemolysin family protein [uncultured Desulfuromonas sp.]
MPTLILYLFIAIFFSFLCSILEAVLLSISPAYIAGKEKEAPKTAHLLNRLKENIDRPLAAILTLNTFAHTIGAAGVGAQAQRLWGNEYLSVVSALLTLAILIFSEIIPKTLGATYWKPLAPLSARITRWMILILYPFVQISQLLTRLLRKSEEESVYSRADLSAISTIGAREGVIHEDESRIIKNLMRFNRIYVNSIMTPRTVVTALPEEMTVADYRKRGIDSPFTRIPVYRESIDQITGFVRRDEVQRQIIEGHHERALKELARKIPVVYEYAPIMALFDSLVGQNEHIAMVVDEYGGFEGIVTIEDLMETLLGIEIVDELDTVEDMQRLARENWEKRARKLGLIPDEGEDR